MKVVTTFFRYVIPRATWQVLSGGLEQWWLVDRGGVSPSITQEQADTWGLNNSDSLRWLTHSLSRVIIHSIGAFTVAHLGNIPRMLCDQIVLVYRCTMTRYHFYVVVTWPDFTFITWPVNPDMAVAIWPDTIVMAVITISDSTLCRWSECQLIRSPVQTFFTFSSFESLDKDQVF